MIIVELRLIGPLFLFQITPGESWGTWSVHLTSRKLQTIKKFACYTQGRTEQYGVVVNAAAVYNGISSDSLS